MGYKRNMQTERTFLNTGNLNPAPMFSSVTRVLKTILSLDKYFFIFRFTFIAPSNEAWNKVKAEFPQVLLFILFIFLIIFFYYLGYLKRKMFKTIKSSVVFNHLDFIKPYFQANLLFCLTGGFLVMTIFFKTWY